MSLNAGWEPAQPGIMIYLPAPQVNVQDAEQSLSQLSMGSSKTQSQLSTISDTIMRTCEDLSGVRVKPEPREDDDFELLRDDSPYTLADDRDGEILLDDISTTVSTPKSSDSQEFLFQLMTAAGVQPLKPIDAISDHDAQSSYMEPIDADYDSSRTDFQETTPSPSLRKVKRQRRPATGTRSRSFRPAPVPLLNTSVVRRLDFRNSRASLSKNPSDSKRSTTRPFERPPVHNYTSDERELLCVLYRFYSSEDDRAIPMIFNAITGLTLRHHIIRKYFHGYMCLYGPESFLCFTRVMSVPIEDPEGFYAEICSKIETEAGQLSVHLQRHTVSPEFASGKASKSGSPRIRDGYKSMVKKTLQEAENEAADAMFEREVATIARRLCLPSRSVRVPPEDYQELFEDTEDGQQIKADMTATDRGTIDRPHLLFRVWDDSNRGRFVDRSFVAEQFLPETWGRRRVPCPPPPDDKYDSFIMAASNHLSKKGGVSKFLSTASSLLQVLCYATEMHRPRLALIDLDAPRMQQEHKVHHAANVIADLRKDGMMSWTRYQGQGEYLVYADIPQDAVINDVDLDNWCEQVKTDHDCRDLLNLDIFQPGTGTAMLASALRERNTILNTPTVRAIGKAAKMLGLASARVSLDHIQDFIARVVDGWSITRSEATDIHTMSTFAATFAQVLGAHDAGHTLQDVMGTFTRGVDSGTYSIAHWSRSRSGSRRQRFRVA